MEDTVTEEKQECPSTMAVFEARDSKDIAQYVTMLRKFTYGKIRKHPVTGIPSDTVRSRAIGDAVSCLRIIRDMIDNSIEKLEGDGKIYYYNNIF